MRHPSIPDQQELAIDSALRGLSLGDLRNEARSRGLTPAGGVEALRGRVKEHMEASHNMHLHGGGVPTDAAGQQRDQLAGRPPRGPGQAPERQLSANRGGISQLQFGSEPSNYGTSAGAIGGSRGGPSSAPIPPAPYGGDAGYGMDPYGAPPMAYGNDYGAPRAAPPPAMQMPSYEAPAPGMGGQDYGYGAAAPSVPQYGRRSSQGSREQREQGGMSAIMNYGVGFDAMGQAAGIAAGGVAARAAAATPPGDGRTPAGRKAQASEGVFSGNDYNYFREAPAAHRMPSANDNGSGAPAGGYLQMNAGAAAAVSRRAQQQGSFSFGDYQYFKEGPAAATPPGKPPRGPGASPAPASAARMAPPPLMAPGMDEPGGGMTMVPPEMMAGVAREMAAYRNGAGMAAVMGGPDMLPSGARTPSGGRFHPQPQSQVFMGDHALPDYKAAAPQPTFLTPRSVDPHGRADAQTVAVDALLKALTVKDMRAELRARGQQPGGGVEQLRTRLKDAILESGDMSEHRLTNPAAAASPLGSAAPGPAPWESPSNAVYGKGATPDRGQRTGNNYSRPNGAQNVGNFISDRPTSRVLAPPGGKSSIGSVLGW